MPSTAEKRPSVFCLFIGHPRTGHSIVGTVLDAHADAVVAHEFNALKAIDNGYSRSQLIFEIVTFAAYQAEVGRIQGPYRYEVPGGWNGRYRTLRVVGDKRAYSTTDLLSRKPWLLQRAEELMEIPVRLIHVVRNPFDCISSHLRYLREPVTDEHLRTAIERFLLEAHTNAKVAAERPASVHLLHHEDFVGKPSSEIARLCRFLDLPVEDEHLSACAEAVYHEPHRSRDEVNWTRPFIEMIRERLKVFPWFRDYAFDR